MGGDLQIDTVNPYDPPERQALEQHLQDDTRLRDETHHMIQEERHLGDSAAAAGYGHSHTDARVQDLEHTEQVMGQKVVQDQQAIDHWDHDHPGWQYGDGGAGADAGDGSGGGDAYAGGDGGDPYGTGDASGGDAYGGGDPYAGDAAGDATG